MTDTTSPLEPPLPRRSDDRLQWCGLAASIDSLTLANAARQHPAPLLVVASDTRSAARLEAELRCFLDRSDDPEVLHLPDWETLAYDAFSPHQDILSQRLATLQRLPEIARGVLVVPITTLAQRLPPPEYLGGRALVLDVGDRFQIETRRAALETAGYRRVDTVMEHGEYAVRGALMDIYPMGSVWPYRIDLFDDEIETLRTFDPESQRTLETVTRVRLLPAHEVPLDRDAIRAFQDRWFRTFGGEARNVPLYRDVSQGAAPPGIEYYLPLFFERLGDLTDYLPAGSAAVLFDDPGQAVQTFYAEVSERYENLRWDPERPILPPDALFLLPDELFERLGHFGQVRFRERTASGPGRARTGRFDFACAALPAVAVDARAGDPTRALRTFLEAGDAAGPPDRVLFTAESAGRREVVLEVLQRAGLRPHVFESFSEFLASDAPSGLLVAPLESGALVGLPDGTRLALLPEATLLGERVRQSRRRSRAADSPEGVIRNLTELRAGAPVVHMEHGVGRYRGLETIDLDGEPAEFLTLEYADGARLYVPVASLHRVSRYTGAEESAAPLHRLGSDQWEKTRRKAAEKVRDAAAELLAIHAQRAARTGFAFPAPDADYERFAAEFPFEETPDQQAAIDAVVHDMCAPQTMDRLVCGDVGFGKTEVAMRAALLAIMAGCQVAVLVPTTLLAQQHFDTFSDRFADWPARIEMLSRFRTNKEIEALKARMSNGQVDIVVGTHKLLGRELAFSNLGLVVIDEEHRFGVRQKDRLKALRAEVDILTLTATPIPRTLNMAVSGLRELSVIATPPAKRLSIKTFVRQKQSGLVKEALLRELLRGGQVFYIHNEVRTIDQAAREVEALTPEARVAVAHGQMRERELERVMSDFYHQRTNVLVCSTIIETGIDIPNANTIIIDRADQLGLAQLHQLRGRVGRSHRQAYAYLLTPHPKAMTADASKRLEAIVEAGELGVGFTLATHDLEIRGAGELLGEEQTGQMEAVGFELYMEMLERAVSAIRDGRSPELEEPIEHGIEINLHIPALIPDDYLPDVHTRLILYKRIASAEDEAALDELRVEMIDRFGELPEPTRNLFRVTRLKLAAERLGIERIDAGAAQGRIEFASQPRIDPTTLVNMVQNAPQRYRLEGGSTLKFSADLDARAARVEFIAELLEHLEHAVPEREAARA